MDNEQTEIEGIPSYDGRRTYTFQPVTFLQDRMTDDWMNWMIDLKTFTI
ncbi:MAG: hypothetical protein GY749_36890 [Desulfobacteraceae bacterium]|nr:hypothetical protein [Desulfobacteraceae bacterium]